MPPMTDYFSHTFFTSSWMPQEDHPEPVEDPDIFTLTEALTWTRLEPLVFPEWADVNFKTPPLPLRADRHAQIVNNPSQPPYKDVSQLDIPVSTDLVTRRKRERVDDRESDGMEEECRKIKNPRIEANTDLVAVRKRKRYDDHLINTMTEEFRKTKKLRAEAAL
ncbi:hypothetical protein K491DRAFT_722391 [Lophiostoma macrostomum CBS 122681]|uniref:Uncharacterized protein n=1 Tax=Lophiostoma macrostomum CBS 122681 TaxID=1314788 RepID=A0A6A6SLB4_9PLEO|nr:hypothetical protein K491DRAFT_722391 [Lophiostoma macrostomum CBS 122681]